jgi:hypothetical protein
MHEGQDEIGAESGCDDEAKDCFKHQITSKPLEKPCINGKNTEGRQANGDKDQV